MEIIEGAYTEDVCIDVIKKARDFAIKVHKGDIRKSEPDKPKFMHVHSVAKILESYGFDKNVIAAGYLHDVVEDARYSFNFTKKDMIEKLRKEFGEDITSLVQGASEPDKSLSWKERKQHTINETRKLPFRNKLVVCADKINNLEDLYLTFEKKGEVDYSAFNSGEKNQRWYYTSVYESLIYGEDKDLPIFKRLKTIIDKVYPETKSNVVLKDKDIRLRKLTAQVVEVQRLKELHQLEEPFVIEFTGTPRTFESNSIQDLYDFFSKYGLKVKLVKDVTKTPAYDEICKNILSELKNTIRKINATSNLPYSQLLHATQENMGTDIVLAERNIVDTQLKNYIEYKNDKKNIDSCLRSIRRFQNISKKSIDFLVVSYADALSVIRKDYNGSFELESFLNAYNDALFNFEFCNDFGAYSKVIDTTGMNADSFALEVAESVMPEIRKKYIKSFNNYYKCN